MSILYKYKNIDPEDLRREVEKHLQWSYAHGHLTIEELEKRLNTLNRTDEKTVILALIEDLPAPEEGDPTREESDTTKENDSYFTLLGSNTRRGLWDVSRYLEVTTILGSQVLDFREARLHKGTTIIKTVALLGSIEMIFPPGVRVTSKGIPILGSVENKVQSESSGPLIHIENIVFMGSVTAKTKK